MGKNESTDANFLLGGFFDENRELDTRLDIKAKKYNIRNRRGKKNILWEKLIEELFLTTCV